MIRRRESIHANSVLTWAARCWNRAAAGSWTRCTQIPGKVYLTGAGPGDPELITLKARRVLESADCILYDNLANPALLELAPEHAERLYVGKKKSAHAFPQEEIAAMLIKRAQAGKTVVRLKGGDPFLFGRGGEEAEALVEAGIPFEVIPGVTSMLGLAAYAGIPLTHREHSSSVTVVTGHEPESIDWTRTGLTDTLVVLMGLTSFGEIARLLIAAGRPSETPAAAVRWATRPDQEILTGTLGTLPGLIAQHGMKPPATIVVGEVAALGRRLNWFARLPLHGQRVVVTRPREQSGSLAFALRELGAHVTELPAIEIRPAADSGPLDRAIEKLEGYGWLIFTSANGVRYFIDRLDRSDKDLSAIRGTVCAIGPATGCTLRSLHLKVRVMGDEFVAESLLEALPGSMAGERVLIPRAAVARDVLPVGLQARGAVVDVVEAYRTEAPAGFPALAAAAVAQLQPRDWLTFTSSSTVRNLVTAIGAECIRNVRVATIGPVTSATAREFGIEVNTEASTYTSEGLVEAILRVG
ncbi:MAG: uroporphyrinogen-III C-methyltransferase [Acidobacteriota bacterium]|nr:uroporphyrinogen-III C-methyltransferase [Acidobacteriota bacterium]